MNQKFLGLLAGMFAILIHCAAANADSITLPTQSFDLTTTQVTFQVVNNPDTSPIVTVTNNSTQSASSQPLTFNRFNPALGTLTAVTIMLSSDYDVTVTITASNKTADDGAPHDDFEITSFFAETTNAFGQKLTGSLISDLLPTTTPTFSASCIIDTIGGNCNNSQPTNNNDFSDTAGLAVPVSSFSGAGTFDLTATLSSALAPRISPDNGTGFSDNATFTGTLTHHWSGDVTVEYTYDPAATAVPEPLSLYLLLSGLGGIALSRHRRR